MMFIRFWSTSAVALAMLAGSAAARPHHINASFAHTSWSFMDHGTKVLESIDANYNYVINAVSGKHIDHGTMTVKGSRICHTSAMSNDGEDCWTVKRVGVGQSTVAVSAAGRRVKVTRISYRKLSIPG